MRRFVLATLTLTALGVGTIDARPAAKRGSVCGANELSCLSPLEADGARRHPHRASAGLGSRRPGGTSKLDVLVVEDEPLAREAVARELREAGYQVGEAASAEAALATAEAAAAASGPPPVVVTGLHLGPGRDGLFLGAEVRRRWPEVGVVYITCRPDALGGRLLGPREHYVVKPFAPETLRQAVRRLMPAWAPGRTPPWAAGLGQAVAAALGLAGAQKGA